MAYMNAEHTKKIRLALKEKYPDIKFSVTCDSHSTVSIAIMESTVDFSDILEGRKRCSINHYWIDRNYSTHAELFKGIMEVANDGNHDDSDLMSDYHDVGWYVDLEIGKYNKPYVQKVGA